MTIAFDAATENGEWTTSPNPNTFVHTPSGTPRGVVVMIRERDTGTDRISAVSYGGVALTRATAVAIDTTTEAGISHLWFKGSGLSAGAQTVSISHDGNSSGKYAVSVTFTAAADTEIIADGRVQEDAANPQVTLDSGARSAMAVGIIHSGLASPASLTMVGFGTAIHDITAGIGCARADRETSPTTGSRAIGYTSSIDDVAFVAALIGEVVAAGTAPSLYTNVSPQRW